MLSFDPSWSVVFDAGVCIAIVWLTRALARRWPFRAAGSTVLTGAGGALCAPVLIFGRVFSLVTSLAVVPALIVTEYSNTEQPLSGGTRSLLAAARILVFGLIVLCLLRPRLVFVETIEKKACAVVLVDVSTSMENKDCDNASRYDAAKKILSDNASVIDEIRQKCDYRFATFAGAFERSDTLPPKPTGTRTNLAGALNEVMKDLAGAPTAGVVVLSDGRHNQSGDPAAAAAKLGAPVFAVLLGAKKGSADFADSSIQRFECPERVFLKNVAPIQLRVAYDGPQTDFPLEVRVEAHDKDDGKAAVETLPPKRITTPRPGATADVDFTYIPKTVGIKRLVAHVTPADKDANLRNNTKELFVRVTESALKVRLIEGEVRWEYKFQRHAIAGAANIELQCINAFLASEGDRARLLPATDEEWEELALIVLGDLPASRFSPEQSERIRKFVADGGALLMVGGFSTLGPGGYGSTPIGKMLPVDVKETDSQTLDPLQIVPTPEGLEHNILRFGPPDETKKIWAALPPISGYTRVTGVKPGAEVLVKTPDGHPVLVVQEYEKGRTAVFAADTTWRWIFNKGEHARYHKAFWRQFVQWLTKSGYGATTGGIWCETDRLRYLTGDTPTLTVRTSGKNIEGSPISALIQGPGMEIRIPIGKAPGPHVLDLPKPVEKSGGYEITVTAQLPPGVKIKDQTELTASTRFVVQEIDVESSEPGADPETMKAIADATEGGRLYERADADQAFKDVLSRRVGASISKRTYKRLWDNMYMYFALGGLLCLEWAARKRKGLA